MQLLYSLRYEVFGGDSVTSSQCRASAEGETRSTFFHNSRRSGWFATAGSGTVLVLLLLLLSHQLPQEV